MSVRKRTWKTAAGEERLTAETLRELLRYAPETGVFTWLVARGNRMAGASAGSSHADNYLRIRIMGRHPASSPNHRRRGRSERGAEPSRPAAIRVLQRVIAANSQPRCGASGLVPFRYPGQ